MPKRLEYTPSPELVKDFQTSYNNLLISKDILDKMREAGEAKPDLEARNKAARERTIRWTTAFKMKLET